MPVVYARIAGNWVPVGGGDSEVWVGPDDPIATLPGTELWYDSDDEPLAADNANYWNSSWGVVAEATVTTVQSGITTQVDLTGFTVTWTPVVGRRYIYRVKTDLASTVAGDIPVLALCDAVDAGMDRHTGRLSGTAGETWSWATRSETFATTTPVTRKLRLSRAAGSGTLQTQCDPTFPGKFIVEDIGPVTKAAVNPPAGQPQVAAAGNALGIVAVGSTSPLNPTSLASNTQTAVTGNLPFTMLAGRRYRVVITLRAIASNTSGASILFVRLRDGTTMMPATSGMPLKYLPPTGYYDMLNYEWTFDGDGVARSWNVTLEPQNLAAGAWGDAQSAFYIEDVGPNQAPALPIPDTPPGWTPATLVNGWINYGGGFVDAGYRKIGDIVYLRGLVRSGTIGATVFTLPVGFRTQPSSTVILTTTSLDAFAEVRIDSAGSVTCNPANNSWVSLSGLQFSVS